MAEPPELLPIHFGSTKFLEGDLAQASCVLKKGELPVNILWKLNHETLMSSNEVNILDVGGRTSILTINPVRSYHQGTYSCFVFNAIGSSEVQTTIEVTGTLLCPILLVTKLFKFKNYPPCSFCFSKKYEISLTLQSLPKYYPLILALQLSSTGIWPKLTA